MFLPMRLISIMTPCFNEEGNVREMYEAVKSVFAGLPQYHYEHIFIDNASTDRTVERVKAIIARDPSVRLIVNARNFGHIRSPYHAIMQASGDAVVSMASDLQDPPEVILEFVGKWLDGYDVVYGVRTERDGESVFKQTSAKVFYRFFSHMSDTQMPLDTGDFRLMDRRVVDALISMPERDRFVRGMVSWLGFSQVAVPYHRASRAAGTTKFSLYKMVRFALDGIFSFSILPLRLATWTGFAASGVAIGGIVVVLLERYFQVPGLVKGWSSAVIGELFIGGVQLICLGIIGEYVGRIYGEAKRRPLYIVRERMGFEARNAVAAANRQALVAGGKR